MIKSGDEFIQVVTKYDMMTAVIKEPYFLALTADDSIWPEIGIREYHLSRIEDQLEGVRIAHFRVKEIPDG